MKCHYFRAEVIAELNLKKTDLSKGLENSFNLLSKAYLYSTISKMII